MRHPSLVRDQLLNLVAGPKGVLEHLRIRLSMYAADEVEVMKQLERPQSYDLGVDIVNVIMERLGHGTAPKEPRFDKTRRALARKEVPRGVRAAVSPERELVHARLDACRGTWPKVAEITGVKVEKIRHFMKKGMGLLAGSEDLGRLVSYFNSTETQNGAPQEEQPLASA